MTAAGGPWALDRDVIFLNHGSFGACPTEVLCYQAALRAEMEAEPVRFLSRELDDRLDAARRALAGFVGAHPDDLAFVVNTTSGVNAVLRSLASRPATSCSPRITPITPARTRWTSPGVGPAPGWWWPRCPFRSRRPTPWWRR